MSATRNKLVVDTDDTINPTGTTSNISLYLYDVNWYIDNDVTPSAWKCGMYDEDNVEVGAVAADLLVINVTAD